MQNYHRIEIEVEHCHRERQREALVDWLAAQASPPRPDDRPRQWLQRSLARLWALTAWLLPAASSRTTRADTIPRATRRLLARPPKREARGSGTVTAPGSRLGAGANRSERQETTMDDRRFDRLVQTLRKVAGSRRGFLRALAGGALGAGLGLPRGRNAAAAPCKKPGKSCVQSEECCSGVCRGRPGRKTCRQAKGQGTCTIKKDICQGDGPLAACGEECSCFIRPNGASFCADTTTFDCLPCEKCPAGTTCVRARNNVCVSCPPGTGDTRTICVRPCPDASP